MKIEAGAPFSICFARSELEAKEYTTLPPPAASYALPISSAAFFRLAAAKIVRSSAATGVAIIATAKRPPSSEFIVLVGEVFISTSPPERSLYPFKYSENRLSVQASQSLDSLVKSAGVAPLYCRLQGFEVGGCRLGGVALDGTEMLDHGLAQRSQNGPAAALTAHLGGNHRLAEAMVQFVDQIPGAAVRHAHGAAGGGNGAVLGNQFEETRFARPERAALAKLHPQIEGRHCRMAFSPRSRSYGAARRR